MVEQMAKALIDKFSVREAVDPDEVDPKQQFLRFLKGRCKKCGSLLDQDGYCTDETSTLQRLSAGGGVYNRSPD